MSEYACWTAEDMNESASNEGESSPDSKRQDVTPTNHYHLDPGMVSVVVLLELAHERISLVDEIVSISFSHCNNLSYLIDFLVELLADYEEAVWTVIELKSSTSRMRDSR